MRDVIASEARRMVMEAAAPVSPGEKIKQQIYRAARSLGYTNGDGWRVEAAWHCKAGAWSAEAWETLKARYQAWDEKQKRLADAAEQVLATRLSALADMLERQDAECFAPDIRGYRELVRKLRDPDTE